MTAVELTYLLLMLLGMLAAIWKYVVMDPAVITDESCRRLRAGLPLLAAFMGVNLLTEFIVIFALGPGRYNHFVYATGASICASLMLAFYSLIAPGKLMKVYAALAVSYLTYFFISHSVWLPGTVITHGAIVGYFGIMTVGSLLFAISCQRKFWGHMRRRVLPLAYLAVLYYLLACATQYFHLSHLAYDSIGRQFLNAVNLTLAFVYYGGILFTVLRVPDKSVAIPAFSKETLRKDFPPF